VGVGKGCSLLDVAVVQIAQEIFFYYETLSQKRHSLHTACVACLSSDSVDTDPGSPWVMGPESESHHLQLVAWKPIV
jgi:hypothetical protein